MIQAMYESSEAFFMVMVAHKVPKWSEEELS